MNEIAKQISSYLGSSMMSDEEFFEHYGTPQRFPGDPHGSGRYREGSGEDPFQHSMNFLSRIDKLKKEGWTETPENIKKEFDMTSTEYRREKSICKDEVRIARVAAAKRLRDNSGYGPTEIAKRMGTTESTVRGWFKEDAESRMLKTRETADFLKKKVDESRYGMIDVGKNVERELNVSREKLDTAIKMLEMQGYHKYGGRMPQPTNNNQSTTLNVLAKPEKKHGDIFEYDKIDTIIDYISKDGGNTFEKKFHYPASLDSKRLQIRYAEDGGKDKDGIIELRRGVKDLDLGESRYAQVRILVDGTHYLKGMALYSDDMPDGCDVIFNTNKHKDKSKMEVLKPIKNDPDNPFGANIKDADQGGQYWYTDKDGKRKLGLINKHKDEGDWSEWKDALPSQFLSKQSRPLAKKQLDLAKATKQAELDEIMSLTNPTIKKYYLNEFASKCDGAAVDLKAAALPGQKYHVIIPVNAMGDEQIYAPKYPNGTKLALIRYPHGGTFEIPILTVNNKNQVAKKLLGTDIDDAVGISSKVAERLSGADFDGDTVMCIPTHDPKGKVKITSTPPLKDLEGFDNKLEYGPDPGSKGLKIDSKGVEHYYRNGREYKVMKKTQTNNEMGKISNLITDMTLGGASEQEIARAVKHSMVVIDAEKHKLDYKQSYIDNGIQELKNTWQVKVDKNRKC